MHIKITLSRQMLFLLLLISLLFFGLGPCNSGGSFELRIMSANTTSGINSAYEGPGIRIFQGLKPDVVLIQEFNYKSGSLRDLVDLAFGEEFDYYVEPGDENIPNGIISRYPIIDSGEWEDPLVDDRDFAWAIIDLPGDKNLQAISMHLMSGGSDIPSREVQAESLKSLITEHFDQNQYIVLGGDTNIRSMGEPAFETFDSFLDPFEHIPVDQLGNMNTSEPRTKPYDWVMPNGTLDAKHIPLTVGNDSFAEGLVFDSAVYPEPLPEPILVGDSHATGMQHMAVIKAYQITY